MSISKEQQAQLKRHAPAHSRKHMATMRKLINKGDSFQTAHQKAIRQSM